MTFSFKKFSRPVWLLAAAIIIAVGLKVHLVALSLPYLGAERFLFMVLSVLSMVFMGKTVFRAYDNRFYLFLVPLLLILSGSYLNFSQQYLNVHIIGAFWVTLLYLSLFIFLEKDTVFHNVIIPGILSGIVLSVNVDLFPIVLPGALLILFYAGKQKVSRVLLSMAVTLLTFLLLVPFSFFLFTPFDMRAPGIYSHLLEDFGISSLFLVLGGIFIAFEKDWKRACIFISFPLVLMVYGVLGGFPSFSFISIYPFYALFAAVGIMEAHRLLREWVKNTVIAGVVVCIAFMAVFPFYRPVQQWAKTKDNPDSRVRAVQWIQNNIPKGTNLVIPEELEMDISTLQTDYHIFTLEFKDLKETTFDTFIFLLKKPYFLVPDVSGFEGMDPVLGRDLKILAGLKKRIETAAIFGTNNVLRNYYCHLPAGDPVFSIGQLKMTREEKAIPLPVEFNVWNPKADPPQHTSPAKKTFFKKGEFAFEFSSGETGNILEVKNLEADKKGERQTGFGFEANRKGLEMDIPEGKYVSLVVNAAISPHLLNKGNYIMISDLSTAGGWESEKQFFLSPGWQTYILRKKVRPGTNRLILGFRFTPQSAEDRLRIRQAGIFISEKILE